MDWVQNEHGLWCPVCGELIAKPEEVAEDDYEPPELCRQCGFPDELDPDAI